MRVENRINNTALGSKLTIFRGHMMDNFRSKFEYFTKITFLLKLVAIITVRCVRSNFGFFGGLTRIGLVRSRDKDKLNN